MPMDDPPKSKVENPPQAPIDYPANYTFKIMGLAADDFPEYARRLVARVIGDVPPERIIVRVSSPAPASSTTDTAICATTSPR